MTNHLNLPKTINFGGGKVIDILYDASGTKLKKTVSGSSTPTNNYTMDYIGGIEYKDAVRGAIYTAEGRVFNNAGTNRYEYTIKDHLGNARVSFTDKDGDGLVEVFNSTANEVLQENHYYPFGLNYDGPWMNDAARDNKYQYNGKEINDDFGLNLNDYGARWYDAAVGRFSAIDRFVDSIPPLSPYNYAGNNPIRNIDVNGDSIIVLSAPDNVPIAGYGLGHAAVLIGSDNGGWSLYSKNGTHSSSGASGPSDVYPEVNVPVGSIEQFANSESNKNEDGSQKYKAGYLIESDYKTDEKMASAAAKSVKSDYNVATNSCIDVCTDALEAGGFNGGTENKMSGSGFSTYESMSPIPNNRYSDIRDNNKGVDVNENRLKPKKQ